MRFVTAVGLLSICLGFHSGALVGWTQSPVERFQRWLELGGNLREISLPNDLASLALSQREAEEASEILWKAWCSQGKEACESAIEKKSFEWDSRELKWLERRFGSLDKGPLPLFLSMHGGGNAPARVNDQQWNNQIRLYEPEQGIVLAPRAPTDTWNLWHEAHMDSLLDRLIAIYVAAGLADPDRVYLMGYSAGGDGVYQLAPRMADRFAAASMMAGHPNESQPFGLRNLPFAIFVGGKDAAYQRNEVAVSWSKKLDELRDADPAGYEHILQVFPEKGHWMDREDRMALPWMLGFHRNPFPQKIVWFQDDVLHDTLYWLLLSPDSPPRAGERIDASVVGNRIDVNRDGDSRLGLELSDALVRLDEPLEVNWNGRQVFSGKVDRTLDALLQSLKRHEDPRRMACSLLWISSNGSSAPAESRSPKRKPEPTMFEPPKEPKAANYDEDRIAPYELPDAMLGPNGNPVSETAAWEPQRRYLVGELERIVYGEVPTEPVARTVELVETGPTCHGKGIRRQYMVRLSRGGLTVPVQMILFLPNSEKNATEAVRTAPCFLGLNFQGNHSLAQDPEISLPKSWMREGDFVEDHRATEAGRNAAERRWPLEEILDRGFAVATAYYGDFDPDFDDGFLNGVHALYPDFRPDEQHPERWGSIAAWAWGLSRLADTLVEIPEVDANQLIVFGHSRLGKTALWAGAKDPRFSIVISNDSGCGGAALSKRAFGETVGRINRVFPHWFCKNFHAYGERESELPLDQHWLLASIAPRALYVASASKDLWADPHGEFLSAWHASRVYAWLGFEGLSEERFPEPNHPIGHRVGYHVREGTHDIVSYDWEQFMNFAENQQGGTHAKYSK